MTDNTLHPTPYVFLSYASADRERALRIADLLEAAGVSIWVDRRSIAGGTSWSGEIVEAIKSCGALVVVISDAAMQSRNVQQEIQLAWEHERKILPLLLERARLPSSVEYVLSGRQWIEVLERAEDEWLPRALKALTGLGLLFRRSELAADPQSIGPTAPLAEPVPRHNLPVQVTSFVGRERELAEIKQRLQGTHLLTLIGTGGCGKTRLALQVAAAVLGEYPDGVWLAELAPLADPELVPATVAATAGIRSGPGQPIQAALLIALRSRRLLILLDNCEHLIDACARLADAILRGCPRVRILATSREGLGIGGEVAWRVPSLAVGLTQPNPSLEDLAESEAVRLFVDRAVAVQPAFALTAQNGPLIARICQRLDGIPLAIELAATRVKALSVEQIATRLDQRFRLLTGGSRAALPRQQTLGALVGWSYDLLSPPERTLFNRLSVFAGGFTLEAAEKVCGVSDDTRFMTPIEDVFDVLGQLVDKSLVVAETDTQGAIRYRLLETLRQYGRERLAVSGEAERLHRRHAAYYLALAEEAGLHVLDRQQLVYLARLDREIDNLRVALQWYLESGEAQEGLRLCYSRGGLFWWFRGYTTEIYSWLTQFLEAPSGREPTAARAKALAIAGDFLWMRGDYLRARVLLLEGLALAREVGSPVATADAMESLGLLDRTTGGPEARHWFEEALTHYRALNDAWGTGEALCHLGQLVLWEGDTRNARRLLDEALALGQMTGDRRRVAFAREVLGELASEEGNVAEARTYLEDCLVGYREIGDLTGVATVENLLGHLEFLAGRLASARQHYRASLRLTRDWSWTERITQSLDGIAALAAAEGRPAQALRLAGASTHLRDLRNVRASSREQAELERTLELARRALGSTEAATAWIEGQAMTMDEAVRYALGETTIEQLPESSTRYHSC